MRTQQTHSRREGEQADQETICFLERSSLWGKEGAEEAPTSPRVHVAGAENTQSQKTLLTRVLYLIPQTHLNAPV